jgi:hypothetical protein
MLLVKKTCLGAQAAATNIVTDQLPSASLLPAAARARNIGQILKV